MGIRRIVRPAALALCGAVPLIDNVEQNVRAWERRGGRGDVFRDEARFVADLASGGIPGLAESAAGGPDRAPARSPRADDGLR
jgi:hypothetical protein